MLEVGREILRGESSPWPKQGQPEQVTQDYVWLGFEYFKGWRLQNLSGQPRPVLDYAHSKNKSVLLCSHGVSHILICFNQLCPVLLRGTTEKSLCPLFSFPQAFI